MTVRSLSPLTIAARLGSPMLLAAFASAQEVPTPADPDALAQGLLEASSRAASTVALTRAGAAGAQALGQLLASEADLDDDALEAACRVLESLGPDAGSAVAGVAHRFYETTQGSHRGRLTRCLGLIGAFDHEARDTWHKRLGDVDGVLSLRSFFLTVGAMKADGKDASADQLIEGLNDANAYVRFGAALVIGHRGSTWPPADRTKLIHALEADLRAQGRPDKFQMTWLWGGGEASTSGSVSDRELETIRRRSQWALARLSPPHSMSALGHTIDFAHTDPIVARRAIQLVMTVAEAGDDDVVHELIGALNGGRPGVAREAAIALGIVGRGSDHAKRELQRVIDSSEQAALVDCARAALESLTRENQADETGNTGSTG